MRTIEDPKLVTLWTRPFSVSILMANKFPGCSSTSSCQQHQIQHHNSHQLDVNPSTLHLVFRTTTPIQPEKFCSWTAARALLSEKSEWNRHVFLSLWRGEKACQDESLIPSPFIANHSSSSVWSTRRILEQLPLLSWMTIIMTTNECLWSTMTSNWYLCLKIVRVLVGAHQTKKNNEKGAHTLRN